MTSLQFAGFALNIFNLIDTTISPWVIFGAGAVVILVMVLYYLRRRRARPATIKFSDLRIVKRAARTRRQRFRFLLLVLRVLAIALFFVAFARPRAGTHYQQVTSKGIDIMMCLDISSSMQAEDFKPNNRLYVAKEEIKKFINRRVNDRIGLVVFARYSYTQCPLTTDYGVLLRFVDQVKSGFIQDGTAIGMAIANAVNRLREVKAKSKIIVLLTDGDNNAGEIDPITAANLAAAFNIKIYTIGAGKPGNAMYPYQDPLFGKRYIYQPTRIDEKTLKEIAKRTDGKYFRARSGKELDNIYKEIDRMEKTKIDIADHVEYTELFQYFVYAGLFLIVLEVLLSNTYFRKLP